VSNIAYPNMENYQLKRFFATIRRLVHMKFLDISPHIDENYMFCNYVKYILSYHKYEVYTFNDAPYELKKYVEEYNSSYIFPHTIFSCDFICKKNSSVFVLTCYEYKYYGKKYNRMKYFSFEKSTFGYHLALERAWYDNNVVKYAHLNSDMDLVLNILKEYLENHHKLIIRYILFHDSLKLKCADYVAENSQLFNKHTLQNLNRDIQKLMWD